MKTYKVRSGRCKFRVEANDPMEAAAIFVLVPFGQLIEVAEGKREDQIYYVATDRALLAAANMTLQDSRCRNDDGARREGR